MLTWESDVRGSLLRALVHYHLDDSGLERQAELCINISICWHWWNNSARSRLLSMMLKCQANVTCRATVWEGGCQWITFNLCVCLIRVGGLELWRPNLCLNCASSSWPWELLCWTECYLFGHLIHTHKWPLGAVFDKQTDWIACVNAGGFSPSLSSRPLQTGPIYLKDMENSTRIHTAHTCAHSI